MEFNPQDAMIVEDFTENKKYLVIPDKELGTYEIAYIELNTVDNSKKNTDMFKKLQDLMIEKQYK